MTIKLLLSLAILGVITGFYGVSYYHHIDIPEDPLYVSFNPYDRSVYAAGVIENNPSDRKSVIARCFVSRRLVGNLPNDLSEGLMFIRGKNTAPIRMNFIQTDNAMTSNNGEQELQLLFKVRNHDIPIGQEIDAYLPEK
jgi:hypothetical protein